MRRATHSNNEYIIYIPITRRNILYRTYVRVFQQDFLVSELKSEINDSCLMGSAEACTEYFEIITYVYRGPSFTFNDRG